MKKYENPLNLTAQFRFCGNPLRADMYRNCTFQCNYCFAKTHMGRDELEKSIECADIKDIEKIFCKAFETNEKSGSVVIELLRHGTPIHIGGTSDPFQHIEFKEHLTYQFIQLCNKYKIPLIFSTKQAELPQEYWDILNPQYHAFQISLISDDDEWIKTYEPNTPSPTKRLAFMKQLKEKGFWVGMRVQPLIDIKQAESVMLKAQEFVDYITLEHLKVATNSPYQMKLFNMSNKLVDWYKPKASRHYEKLPYVKENEIKYLMSKITKCKIGVGDNDLHHLTQSRCCCGVDTMGEKFQNYLKYNTTYFLTGDYTPEMANELYTPENNVSGCFGSDCVVKGMTLLKDYVDRYCVDNLKYLSMKKRLYDYYSNYMFKKENQHKFDKTQNQKDQMSIFDFID